MGGKEEYWREGWRNAQEGGTKKRTKAGKKKRTMMINTHTQTRRKMLIQCRGGAQLKIAIREP